MLVFAISLMLLPLAPAVAETWSCRNHDFEIRCMAGEPCSFEQLGGFTPMDLVVDVRKGRIFLGIYESHWRGRASTLQRSGRFLIVSGLKRPVSTNVEDKAKIDFAATIDTTSRIATFLTGDVAQPMRCKTGGEIP